MNEKWEDILVAYLHDPPDKALSIRGHEQRACTYLAAALNREVTPSELHGTEDQLASVAERLPMPDAKAKNRATIVEPLDGQLTVCHPLAPAHDRLAVGPLQEAWLETTVRGLTANCDDLRSRFHALWRLLPDRLAETHSWYDRLPADTRVPDHTIWHHLNITAGLKPALSGKHGAALLSFTLGPVQAFIEAARSVRDLWSGSMILSWLTFQAMLPVIEQFGPTAIVYPSLRGTPLLDLWLRKELSLDVPQPSAEARMAPCLPNRFLAVVPWEPDAAPSDALGERCAARARQKWKGMADAVRSGLTRRLEEKGVACDGWDRRWEQQIDSYFEFRTTTLPLRECGDEVLARLAGCQEFQHAFPELAAVRGLATAIPEAERPGYRQDSGGLWQEQVDLSARLMAASRSVRPVPQGMTEQRSPAKCSLFGTWEQMGPDAFQDSATFWREAARAIGWEGARLRSRESLGAVALVKRFAAPALLRDELQLGAQALRFPDTATVAAAQWLASACQKGFALDPEQVRREHDDWSGQWLHWPTQHFDEDEQRVPDPVWDAIRRARREIDPPPAYYAVLVMDGDHMGEWLAGERSPKVGQVLHPEVKKYFEGLQETAPGLEARRPLGPARHAAMSEALANFALHAVPAIVRKHGGTLIYAGGDDVLALLPRRTALACARELRLAFSGDRRANGGAPQGYYRHQGRDLLTMGPAATASTGLAVVHYKEDLRAALRAARSAERAAKRHGRDILQIATCRRSGEHAAVLCPWEFAEEVAGWVAAFEQGASDRWAYHLRQELETLRGIPVEAARAEIRRQMERTEKETRSQFCRAGASAGESLAAAFDRYRALLIDSRRELDDAHVLRDFIVLCQTASFLAREEGER